MVKIAIMIGVFTLSLCSDDLQESCLACHQKEQIPSAMIYKRYLMKYSTNARIEKEIYTYLKNPSKARSIMPKVFFTKFPMKEKLIEDDDKLRNDIKAYLKQFDVKRRLVNSH